MGAAPPLPAPVVTAPQRLFCYGTLQIPAVLEAVIGRPLAGLDARLPGFSAFMIRGEVYPGIVRTAGGMTAGRLYPSCSPLELAVLDRFEGRLYRRLALPVTTADGRRVRAWVYGIACGREKMLTATPWRLEVFTRARYARFMQRFVRDRRTLYTT